MKLETTLPDRPGFLHALPLFDLFALLLVLLMLGPSFVNQAGVQVELPVSRFRIEQHPDASVVTLTPGDPPALWLERERMDEERLLGVLTARREQLAGVPVLYLRSAADVPTGSERRVAEEALALGYRVYLLGRTEGNE